MVCSFGNFPLWSVHSQRTELKRREAMMLSIQAAPSVALPSSLLTLPNPNPNRSLFSRFSNRNPKRTPQTTLTAFAAADGEAGPTTTPRPSSPPPPPPPTKEAENSTVFVGVGDGDDGVPLEGVIQVEKPVTAPSKLVSWAQVALLAGGDVLCLLVFSAIGRFSHGFPVLDLETFRTADPFVAGWFLGAYFLGGFGDDGKGVNGPSKAIIAAAKSWVVGIPLGILIRAATSGHFPPTVFMLVTMGSTGVLLVGWRVVASKFLMSKQSRKTDMYKHGNAFELFELLTSLVRRW